MSKDIRNEILGIWKNREKDAKDLMANDPSNSIHREKLGDLDYISNSLPRDLENCICLFIPLSKDLLISFISFIGSWQPCPYYQL